jgi:threonyl-tRNA synthetase
MLVLGDQEKEQGVIAVRDRSTGKTQVMTLDEFIAKVQNEVKSMQNS